jgi:hexosaminidase
MKFILILLFAWFQMLKYKRAIEPLPWPQNINLTEGTFALNKSFKINITGENGRIFIGATNFYVDWMAEQDCFRASLLTKTNEYRSRITNKLYSKWKNRNQ